MVIWYIHLYFCNQDLKDKPIKITNGKNSDHILITSQNSNEPSQFSFDKILESCSQQQAFESIGLKICIDALNGYNGTVFACLLFITQTI